LPTVVDAAGSSGMVLEAGVASTGLPKEELR
jgi:hypothetical protein